MRLWSVVVSQDVSERIDDGTRRLRLRADRRMLERALGREVEEKRESWQDLLEAIDHRRRNRYDLLQKLDVRISRFGHPTSAPQIRH